MRVVSRSLVAPSAATSWVMRAVVSRPETMPSTLRLAIRCLRWGSGECSVRSEGGGQSLPPHRVVRSCYLLRCSGPASAEELQDTLRALVGLSQHRGAACDRICDRVKLTISCAMSVSRMRLSDAERFSTATFTLL